MISFQKAVLPFLTISALFAVFFAKEGTEPPEPSFEPVVETTDDALFSPVSFNDLTGWRDDDVLQALPAMKKSCEAVLHKKRAYKKICSGLKNKNFSNADELRAFLEKTMTPYAVNGGKEGVFTGYYEPEIPASSVRTKKFSVPLYEMPDDLVSFSVKDFSKDRPNESFFGKVSNGKLKPYFNRAQIEKNGVPAKVIAYVEHKADAFILQIQGSGVLIFPDNKRIRVGYAANNGHVFTGIGKIMLKKKLLKKGKADMNSIRRFLIDNPELGDTLMRENKRYIFFKINKNLGATGALGVVLTPERSLAVDPKYIPLGSFLWLQTERPEMDRLVCAQDTGAAIKGKVRGDFFFGTGHKAFEQAAVMKTQGIYFILLPKSDKKGINR